MLDKFQILNTIFPKKQAKSPGLLSIYIANDFVTFAYTRKKTAQPVVDKLERIPMQADELESVLAKFMNKHHLSNVDTIVTLNPMDYRLIYLDAPNVNDDELGAAAKWLVKEFIQFPLSNAAVDAFRVPTRSGQPSKMYAVVAQIDRLQSIVNTCEKVGMNVIVIDIAELSLRNLMKLLQQDEKEVGLLFMRPDFHAVLVSDGDILCFSRNIEANLPKASMDKENREVLLEYLINEIERSVYFYESNIGNKSLDKIWISCTSEEHEFLVNALSEKATIRCESLEFTQVFKSAHGVNLSSNIHGGIALGGLMREI